MITYNGLNFAGFKDLGPAMFSSKIISFKHVCKTKSTYS